MQERYVASEQHRLAGIKCAAKRWGIEPPPGLDGDIFLAKAERELAKLRAARPPLTPAHLDKLAALLFRVAAT